MNRATSGVLAFILALPLIAAVGGCEDKKPSTDTARPDASAGTDKYATADPKLAKALQAAASASADSNSGPPPGGIFAAGVADQRHPKGVPTKVDVLGDGAEPRVTIGDAADASAGAARASSYGQAALEVAQQPSQRSPPLTLDFGLVLAPGKADEGGTDVLVANVKSVSLSKEQSGQTSPGMDKDVATLQGSQLRLKLGPDGKQSDLSMLLGKTSKPDFDRLLQNAAEALAMVVVPAPGKPVGVGAQWIAETRMPLAGYDVIAYRAFRVKSIEGDRLRLSLDLKAYAADKTTQLAGIPPGATLQQFDAVGQGEMEVVRTEMLARKADLQQRVVMIFAAPGASEKPQGAQPAQPQVMTAQISEQATFVRGDDLRQALRHP